MGFAEPGLRYSSGQRPSDFRSSHLPQKALASLSSWIHRLNLETLSSGRLPGDYLQLVPERELAYLLRDRLRAGGRNDGKPADEVHVVCGDLWK